MKIFKKSYHSHCQSLRTQQVGKPLCVVGIFIKMEYKVNKGRFNDMPYISVEVEKIDFLDFLQLKEKPHIYYNENVYFHLHSNLFTIADFRYSDDKESYVYINEDSLFIVKNGICKNEKLSKFILDVFCDKNIVQKAQNTQKTYIMIDHNTGFYKIGKSSNPAIREKTLQSEKPTIDIVLICEKNIESDLHSIYESKRIRGEWFNLNADDILDIIEQYNFKNA